MQFFDNFILNKRDSINIRFYSWEGEALIRTINSDGKKIEFIVYANTNSNEIIQIFSGDRFIKEKNDNLIECKLYDKDKFIVRLLYYRN